MTHITSLILGIGAVMLLFYFEPNFVVEKKKVFLFYNSLFKRIRKYKYLFTLK